MSNPAQQLIKFGQSVWYDNISRELLDSGELKKMIAEWGVRGLTSNPTIFDNAISKSNTYDAQIQQLKGLGSPDKIFEELALKDLQDAADLLRPVFDQSQGDDGFVSMEVSPLLAANTEGTIEEARRLFKKLNRPNVMIKIPGTPEGLPAVRMALEEGIHVNITLLFSVENYVAVAKTYCEALRARAQKGLAVDKIRSVASFFVSRVDNSTDAELQKIIADPAANSARKELAQSLLGQFGIANSKIAFQHFLSIFKGKEFADLQARGAKAQRPLWASTGTKNPKYSDVMYIDNLIGPETVNTIPHATLAAFVDHGKAAATITQDVPQAEYVPTQLTELGIDLEDILKKLQEDGVKKFSESFVALNDSVRKKMS